MRHNVAMSTGRGDGGHGCDVPTLRSSDIPFWIALSTLPCRSLNKKVSDTAVLRHELRAFFINFHSANGINSHCRPPSGSPFERCRRYAINHLSNSIPVSRRLLRSRMLKPARGATRISWSTVASMSRPVFSSRGTLRMGTRGVFASDCATLGRHLLWSECAAKGTVCTHRTRVSRGAKHM
jgi:hypothetical protein